MTRYLVLTQRGGTLHGTVRHSWCTAPSVAEALQRTFGLERDANGVYYLSGDLREGDELLVAEVVEFRRFPVETHRATMPADVFTGQPE